jgi:hypothetical protein
MKSEVIITEQELPTEVLKAIEKGRKVVAIKLLREATGLGLANAKVLVDRAATKYSQQRPSPLLTETHGNAASLLKMLLAVALIFAVYRFFLAG